MSRDLVERDLKHKARLRAYLIVAMITNLSVPFAATSVNIAVPHIGTEFHASATSLTWVVLSFLFVTALCPIPFGRVADIRGKKGILKLGIALFCAGAVLNAFSVSMPMFLALRVLQGVGASMIFATNAAIVVEEYPPEKRGSVLGLTVAAVYTGSACGPVVGGLLMHRFGWRSIFVMIAVISFVALCMALAKLPRDEKAEGSARLNTGSLVLFMVSLGLVMYGLATLTQNLASYFILAAGVVFVIVFIKHELRAETPVIKVCLFTGNPTFALSNLAAMFNYAATFAVAYLMSLYLQLVKGYSADISGIIMICQPAAQTVLSPIVGRIADRRPPETIASSGMACCAGALAMFAFLDAGTPPAYVLAGLLLTGVGIGLFSSPNASVILGSVSRGDYGVATSVQSTARTFGQAVGMALITIIINKVIGNVPIEQVAAGRIVADMHITFAIFAAICVVGVFISLRRNARI